MRFIKGVGLVLGLVFGVIYILNPGFGLFEAIPDALPIIGNLDEAAAVALIATSVRGLRALRAPAPRATTPKKIV